MLHHSVQEKKKKLKNLVSSNTNWIKNYITCLIGRKFNNNSLNSDSTSADSEPEVLFTFALLGGFGKHELAGSRRINFSISCLPISM